MRWKAPPAGILNLIVLFLSLFCCCSAAALLVAVLLLFNRMPAA